jgi:hypothetical protein
MRCLGNTLLATLDRIVTQKEEVGYPKVASYTFGMMSLLACGRWCGNVRFRGVDVEPLDVAVLRKLSCKTKITHEIERSTELVDTKRGRFLKNWGADYPAC